MSYTQGKIILQLNGLLHLEHKDVSKEKHSIEHISGSISFDTTTKINTIELKSLNNKAFNEKSGFACLLSILDSLLFGSDDKSKSKNIIDFSPSGFSGEEYISFGENGYAQKNIEVTKIQS